MRNLKVGDIVKLKQDLLGNMEGDEGVVFQEYNFPEFTVDGKKTIAPGPGVQVIFENGEYDGFSDTEQRNLLERIGHIAELADYQFVNVAKVCQDFESGVFDVAFN